MAATYTIGAEVLTGPGEPPPIAPKGTRWEVVNVIFSDTGGATLWKLVASGDEAGLFVSGLQSEFTAGMLAFLQSLAIGAGVRGKLGKTRPLCFSNFTLTATPMTWLADKDYNFLGAYIPGGWQVVISVYPLVNPIGTDTKPTVRDGVLLASAASTPGMLGTIPAIPIEKGTTLYVWFSAASGIVTVYLEDAS